MANRCCPAFENGPEINLPPFSNMTSDAREKGADLFFREGTRPDLPSSFDAKPGDPLHFVYEAAIAGQMATLQTFTNQR